MLYIVSTPIGNLEDITLRALRILKEVDYIVAEDTRHSKVLLHKYGIETPMLSFHSHSGKARLEKILEMLANDKDVALISDAGTPGISDPGYVLISEAIAKGIRVVPVPGASALLCALVGSGLPMDKFIYIGFLPLKKGRQTLFQSFINEKRTVVFYESPRRIIKTLTQIREFIGGEPQVVVARELTKIYEEFLRGSLDFVLNELKTRGELKGEFVVLLNTNCC